MRRSRSTPVFLGFSLLMFALSFFPNALAQSNWATSNTWHIGGEGGWDYVTVDPQTHRLYIPRSTHLMVIDTESGKVVADIPGQKRNHGVALVPSARRGFISDGGGEGAVVIFDLKSNKVLGTIKAQPDADGIIYDSASDRVLVVSGDGGTLMSLKPDVNPKTGKLDPAIDLGGKPEFLSADGKGKVYVNLVDKNQVAVIDMKTRKVLAHWPTAPGGSPVGMSMEKDKRLLFIGCRNPQKMIVMNADNGQIVADLPIGAGVDATRFDDGQAFASCRDGKLIVAGENSGKFEVMQTVETPQGARTMDIDPDTHTIYLPTAEFEPSSGTSRRPTMKPGSFMIVVVTRP
ncbi:MAG TPA: YncE family protein [Terriglobales bacterium]|nr:YncE family protein [Terriglobales bacterium]